MVRKTASNNANKSPVPARSSYILFERFERGFNEPVTAMRGSIRSRHGPLGHKRNANGFEITEASLTAENGLARWSHLSANFI